MNGNDRKQPGREGPGWLSGESTHLAVVFGDDQIVSAISRVGQPHCMLTMDSHSYRLPRQPGCAPSLADLRKGLRQCWRDTVEPTSGGFVLDAEPGLWNGHRCRLGMDHVLSAARFYWQRRRMPSNHCFVCLPAYCSGCTDAAAGIDIPLRPGGVRRRVTARHLRRLIGVLCRRHTPDGQTAIAVVPEYYTLDRAPRSRKVSNPMDHEAEYLEVRAHIFHADEGITYSLTELMEDMNLHVRMLATPQMLGRELIPEPELASDCAVAVAGPRHVTCGFYRSGVLVRADQVEAGTEEMLEAMASRLRVEESDLAAILAAKRDWLVWPERYGSQRLGLKPKSGGNGVTVQEVVDAAADAAVPVYRQVQSLLQRVEKDRGFRVRWLRIAGDQPVLMRALAAAASVDHPGQCRALTPRMSGTHAEIPPPEQTRMAGLLWLGALHPPAYQPYLGIYKPPPAEDPDDKDSSQEPPIWADIVRAWRRTAPQVAAVCRSAYQMLFFRPDPTPDRNPPEGAREPDPADAGQTNGVGDRAA